MRIGLISSPVIKTPPDRYGGLERMVWWLADELELLGHEVILVAKEGSKNPGTLYEGHNNTEEELADIAGQHLNEVDVWHDNTHDKIFLRKYSPSCYVTTLHVQHRAWEKNVICISKAQRDYVGFSDTVPVVYHGINTAEYGCSYEKDNYLLFMGSLMPYKNPSAAIRLAKELDVPLYLAGICWDSNYWDDLKKEFGGNIVYVGDVGGAEKQQLLRKAKALIHPVASDYEYRGRKERWCEAGAIVVLEALVSATPVLSTPYGCIPEYIEQGKQGFMCETLEDLIKAYENLDKISKSSCVKRGLEFNSRKMAEEYLEQYTRVLKGESW